MQWIEVIDAFLVVVVQDGEETNDNTRERQRVENSVQQLHVDASEAPADTVQQYRWNEKIREFKGMVQIRGNHSWHYTWAAVVMTWCQNSTLPFL